MNSRKEREGGYRAVHCAQLAKNSITGHKRISDEAKETY